MTSTILLATDGSDPSRQAEDFVIEHFTPEGHRLHVVHVIPEMPHPYASADVNAQVQTRLIEGAEELLDQVRERLEETGFDVATEVLYGDPGEKITDAADEFGADVVVMGRRGRGTVGELMLGSVSRYVIHHTHRPVMVVPARKE